MRLIDADAIKDKAWKAESEACFYALEDVVSVTDIDEAPSIDIVRCKECKWCLVEEGGCERIGMVLFADEIENHFCGYGERREP